jgi:hypothetical protein
LRLVAGGWFVLREKYCWLVADKPSEQALWRKPKQNHRNGLLALLGVGKKRKKEKEIRHRLLHSRVRRTSPKSPDEIVVGGTRSCTR